MSLPRTLVLIQTDPRRSLRPAEGVRIAAGIGAWRKTEVTLLFCGPAGYCLQEFTDELVDEDNFVRYLPLVLEGPNPIYLEDTFTDLDALIGSEIPYQMLPQTETAALLLAHDYLIRF